VIKLFDKKFDINSIQQIYGIVNVPEDNYSYGLTSFNVSNVFQVRKLLSKSEPTFVAISVNPSVNAQKNGKIKEIVQLTNYKLTGLVKSNNRVPTTGYGIINCNPIVSFEELSQNRSFFNIKPHGQYLIKQILPIQSELIIKYIKNNIGE